MLANVYHKELIEADNDVEVRHRQYKHTSLMLAKSYQKGMNQDSLNVEGVQGFRLRKQK